MSSSSSSSSSSSDSGKEKTGDSEVKKKPDIEGAGSPEPEEKIDNKQTDSLVKSDDAPDRRTLTINDDDEEKPQNSKPGVIIRNKGTVIVTFLAAASFATGAYFLLNNYLPENLFGSDDSNSDEKDRRLAFVGANAAAGLVGGALGFGAARLTNFFCNREPNEVEMKKSKIIQQNVEDPNEKTPLVLSSNKN